MQAKLVFNKIVNKQTSLFFYGLLVIAGIIFAKYCPINFYSSLVLVLTSIVFAFFKQKNIFLAVAFFFTGSSFFLLPTTKNHIKNISKNQFVQSFEGKILAPKGKGYIVKLLTLNKLKVNGKIIFYPALKKQLPINSQITAIAEFNKPMQSKNPNGFNAKKYYSSKKIYFQAFGKTPTKVIKLHKLTFLQTIKIKLNKRIEQLFKQNSNFVKSILLAGKKPEVYKLFQKTQTAHLMAVSGLHLGLLAFIILVVLKPFIKKYAYLIVLLICFFYLALCNFTPALTRAYLMLLYYCLGVFMQRKVYMFNALGFSMIFAPLLNPASIFELGFILSYFAVFIIFILLKVFKRFNNKQKTFLLAACVPYLMLGISLFYFNNLNFVGLISNLILSAIFSFIFGLSLLVLVSGLWLNAFANSYIFFIWIGKKLEHLPLNFSYISFNFYQMLAFYLFCFLALYFIYAKKHIKSIITLALSFGILIIPIKANNKLKITSFSAKNSDIHLIQTPNNKNILIDLSNPETSNINAENACFSYFKKQGINYFDAAFVTHNHSDHCGGYQLINKNFPIKKLYASKKVINTVKAVNFEIVADTLTTFIDEVKLQIIHPKKGYYSENENNNSLVIKLVYKDFSMLFTGDIENEVEQLLVDNDNIKNIDVLKVAHHGSKTSSLNNFVKNVKAKIAVIPAENKNGFPSKNTLQTLKKYCKQTFVCANGAVIIETDGLKKAKATSFGGLSLIFNL